MIREAAVIAIGPGVATVRFDLDCAPDDCSRCNACATGKPPRSMDVSIMTNTELAIGRIVTINISLPNAVHVALLVFGLPLLLALIAGGLGLSYGEPFAILCGVGGLATGFGMVWLVEHSTSLLKTRALLEENN